MKAEETKLLEIEVECKYLVCLDPFSNDLVLQSCQLSSLQ